VLLEDFYSLSDIIRIDVEPAEQVIVAPPEEFRSRRRETMVVGLEDTMSDSIRCPANEEDEARKNDRQGHNFKAMSNE